MTVLLALALGIACGLNPYVSVAIVSIAAARSELVTLAPGFGFVAANATLAAALLLLPIDLFADKLPGPGGVMDRVGWALRPAAGGMLGGAVAASGGLALLGGLALGALAALGTHALRLRVRQRVQWRLLGFGRVVFGVYADFGSGIVAATALLAPPLGLALGLSLAGLAGYVDRRWGAEAPVAAAEASAAPKA